MPLNPLTSIWASREIRQHLPSMKSLVHFKLLDIKISEAGVSLYENELDYLDLIRQSKIRNGE